MVSLHSYFWVLVRPRSVNYWIKRPEESRPLLSESADSGPEWEVEVSATTSGGENEHEVRRMEDGAEGPGESAGSQQLLLRGERLNHSLERGTSRGVLVFQPSASDRSVEHGRSPQDNNSSCTTLFLWQRTKKAFRSSAFFHGEIFLFPEVGVLGGFLGRAKLVVVGSVHF